MFESLLTIENVFWAGDAFCPGMPSADVRGRFASASADAEGVVTLARDPLGLNKLFVSMDQGGATVAAANYLSDLIHRGVPFEGIASVPPGHVARLDPTRGTTTLQRYARRETRPVEVNTPLCELAREIRCALDTWFGRLAAQFGNRRIHVCLSGGLDSGIIAALARRSFANVIGYTYTFADAGAPSEDAINAERLADALRMPLRIVSASSDDVLDVLDDAIRGGQDWRDFNVHCAIVNEILGRAMRRDLDRESPDAACAVITGDLANELLADYTPVSYAGREFYSLPDVEAGRLRQTLVRGLDAGDREVGVFARHGLAVIQPYALVADEYLRLPGGLLGRDGFKQALSREIAGDLLPEFIFERRKVRAQIGNATASTGILPLLVERGVDTAWLRQAFCRIFSVRDEGCLDRFIRAGRYRVMNTAPAGRSSVAA